MNILQKIDASLQLTGHNSNYTMFSDEDEE